MLSRLHLSTWAVACLVFAIGVSANVGGDRNTSQTVDFGWPWIFGSTPTQVYGWNPKFPPENCLWRLDWIEAWHFGALAANVATVLILVTLSAAVWEWRRRLRNRWWQFSLADGALALTLLCLAAARVRSLYRDQLTEARLHAALTGHYISLEVSRDVPADWFWEGLRIPPAYRPSTIRRISLSNRGYSAQDLPPRAFEVVGEFPGLNTLQLRWTRLPKSCPTPDFAALEYLNLDLSIDRAQLLHFSKTKSLQSVGIDSSFIQEQDLQLLAGNRNLRYLSIKSAPEVDLTSVSHWPKLANLTVDDVGLTPAGCQAVAALPQLEYLEIRNCPQLTGQEWSVLATAPALKILGVTGLLDDQAAEAFSRSTTLHCVALADTQVTDAGLLLLTRIKSLQMLKITGDASDLTDSSLEHLTQFHRQYRESHAWPFQAEVHVQWASPASELAAKEAGVDVRVACQEPGPAPAPLPASSASVTWQPMPLPLPPPPEPFK